MTMVDFDFHKEIVYAFGDIVYKCESVQICLNCGDMHGFDCGCACSQKHAFSSHTDSEWVLDTSRDPAAAELG